MTSDDDQQLPLLSGMMSSFSWWCSSSSWWWSFTIASAVDDTASVDANDANVADIYTVDVDDDSRRIPLLVKEEC